MAAMTDGPLIVQSDKTVLLEVDHEQAAAARQAIAPFAELERAPEHVHTYRITPLALWNARAAGHDAEQVVDALVNHSRYAVPQPLLVDIVDTMARYGRLQLVDVVAGPLDRAFGIATVRLHTAAATTDATIPGLTPDRAASLRDQLVALGESRGAGM